MSSSHPKPNNRRHIANRRSEVWTYLCQGMTRQDIAKALKVDASTISRDIEYLTLKSQQYIDDMAKKTLPFIYKKSIDGINEALKECWHIYNQKDTVPPLVIICIEVS
jgi:IS30 family transposase